MQFENEVFILSLLQFWNLHKHSQAYLSCLSCEKLVENSHYKFQVKLYGFWYFQCSTFNRKCNSLQRFFSWLFFRKTLEISPLSANFPRLENLRTLSANKRINLSCNCYKNSIYHKLFFVGTRSKFVVSGEAWKGEYQ